MVGDDGVVRARRGSLEVTAHGDTRSEDLSDCQNVTEELAAFAAAVRDGEPHRNSPLEALRDLAVVEAMLQAAASGSRIKIDDFAELETSP